MVFLAYCSTISFVIMIHLFFLLLMSGASNITSRINNSITDRRPRAPVPSSRALSAILFNASSEKERFIPSISSSSLYSLTRAPLGSLKIRTNSSLPSVSTWEIIGKRPTNSGIIPNSRRSCGVTESKRFCPSSFLLGQSKPILPVERGWQNLGRPEYHGTSLDGTPRQWQARVQSPSRCNELLGSSLKESQSLPVCIRNTKQYDRHQKDPSGSH